MNSSILNYFKFFVKIETSAECSAGEEVVSLWLLAANFVALSGKISIVASYVPPGSDSGLYQAHLDNLSNIRASLEDSDGICVARDFNLSSVLWTWAPNICYGARKWASFTLNNCH